MRAKVGPERLQLLARRASVATRQEGQTGDLGGTRRGHGLNSYPSDTRMPNLIVIIKTLRELAPPPPSRESAGTLFCKK